MAMSIEEQTARVRALQQARRDPLALRPRVPEPAPRRAAGNGSAADLRNRLLQMRERLLAALAFEVDPDKLRLVADISITLQTLDGQPPPKA